MSSNRVYLYLAKRNKQSVRVVTIIKGPTMTATKVDNVNDLRLPANLLFEIKNIAEANRMEYDLYLESAENYDILRTKLIRRGYSNVPAVSDPIQPESVFTTLLPIESGAVVPKKTMVRKA